jgi:quinol monooxygenase YgiN
MSQPSNHSASQVGVLVKFTAQPGKGADLAAVLADIATEVADEPGTMLWQVDRQADLPDVVFLYERYASPEALNVHNDTELNARTRAATGALLGGPPEIFPLLPAGGIR